MKANNAFEEPALFLNKDQVASLLQVSRRTVDALMAAKKLPFYKLNPHLVRFRREDVLEHLRQNFRVQAAGFDSFSNQ